MGDFPQGKAFIASADPALLAIATRQFEAAHGPASADSRKVIVEAVPLNVEDPADLLRQAGRVVTSCVGLDLDSICVVTAGVEAVPERSLLGRLKDRRLVTPKEMSARLETAARAGGGLLVLTYIGKDGENAQATIGDILNERWPAILTRYDADDI